MCATKPVYGWETGTPAKAFDNGSTLKKHAVEKEGKWNSRDAFPERIPSYLKYLIAGPTSP